MAKRKVKLIIITLIVALIMSTVTVPVMASTENTQGSEISISSSIDQNWVIKGSRRTFTVWASDTQGNIIKDGEGLNVALDGKKLTAVWQDSECATYNLNFSGKTEGEHTITITATSGESSRSETYKVIYEAADTGEFLGYASVSIEAFTVEMGYIVEPTMIPIYEGENTATAVVELLQENGYDINNSGTLTQDFYLASIVGSNAKNPKNATKEIHPEKASIHEGVAQSFPKIGFDRTLYTEGTLGEFNFTQGSGWMYSVNSIFPNVSFAGYYLNPGDTVRVQYTLNLGKDIQSGTLEDESIYKVANKNNLTQLLSEINFAPSSAEIKKEEAILNAIDEAYEVLYNVTASQEEIDNAEAKIRALLKGEVKGIELDKEKLTLENQTTYKLNAKVSVEGSPITPVTWTSSDVNVAKVKNGKVTATGSGSAVITATCGDYSAACTVTVPRTPITGITLNLNNAIIQKGKTTNLVAAVAPENTTDDKTISWLTEDSKIATVDENGKVTGVSPGSTTITAKISTVDGTFEERCSVTVNGIPATDASISYYTKAIKKGGYTYLSGTASPEDTTDEMKWSSSDESIVTISQSGKATGISAGTAIIKYTSETGNVSAQCIVQVIDETATPTKALSLSSVDEKLVKGKSATIVADTNGGKDPVIWESSNSLVVTVNNGELKAAGEGTATVTAYSGNQKARCTVTVTEEVKSPVVQPVEPVKPAKAKINLNYSKLPLQKGKSTTAVKIKSKNYSSDYIKKAKSSNTKIATVSVKNGKLTIKGKKKGTVTITVTSAKGATDKVKIVVKKKVNVTKLTINKKKVKIKKGKKTTLKVTKNPVTATNKITWKSSNSKIATVNSKGVVKGKKKGTVTITARSSNGKTVKCKVTVK